MVSVLGAELEVREPTLRARQARHAFAARFLILLGPLRELSMVPAAADEGQASVRISRPYRGHVEAESGSSYVGDRKRDVELWGSLRGRLSVCHPDSGVDQDQGPGKPPRDYLQ